MKPARDLWSRLNSSTRTVTRAVGTLTPPARSRDDGSQPLPLFDESFLERIRPFALNSRRVAAVGVAGERRSRRKGSSPEFTDFKMYTPGDDYRHIDWRTYARFDELFVRESETTAEFDVHIMVDISRSMAWRGSDDGPTKLHYALQVTGALAYLSLWHFDHTAMVAFGDGPVATFGPAQGRANIVPMLRFLAAVKPVSDTNVAGAIGGYVHARRRPGILIVLSDLLAGEPADLEAPLREARNRGWEVSLLHVIDPLEEDPAGLSIPGEVLELIDQESNQRLRVAPDGAVLATYRQQRGDWLTRLREVCAHYDARLEPVLTSVPLETMVVQRMGAIGLVGR
jgi:uncharacterized protein (DUF58 family)